MLRAHLADATTAVLAILMAATLTSLGGTFGQSPPSTFVAAEAADGDLFGTSVDVSGALVAVGASSTDLERDDVGVVYLFDASADDVAQVARLAAADGELAGSFGGSVAISSDAALVGAPRVLQSELNEGAAYLFERERDAWSEVAELRRETTSRNDMFGAAVALDGGIAVVGGPGADAAGEDSGTAVVYERLDGGWEQVGALTPGGAGGGERFGSAVAVDGERILVGATGDTVAGEDAGSAYVLERAGDGWREMARLTPSDGRGGDAFGGAVALVDDLAVIGARFADLSGSDEGAAYVFERTNDGWEQAGKLTAPEPADRDQFGRSVALAGDVVLVGAPRVDEPERDAGGVWTFVRRADGWAIRGRLAPDDPAMYDEFGSALAADGTVAVVGTPQDIPEGETEENVTGTATLFREVR